VHRTVDLKTEIPGPRSRELARRRDRVVPRGVSPGAPVYVQSARAATMTDVDGNVLLDFAGGIGVLNVGSSHPEVVAAVREQAAHFLHTSFQSVPYEGYVAVAEELARIAPGDSPKKVLLMNSGAEATENAVKIARHHTGRQAVIVFSHAFHGRTMLALAMTGKHTYKDGYGPFPPDVHRVAFPYPYRGPSEEEAWGAFRFKVENELGPTHVAAVLVEPVIGEGGFLLAPHAFLRRVRDYCAEHGIVFIADEVQTGFARTGRTFACEHYGIEPDLLCVAKSISAGMPLSAVVGAAAMMDSPAPGGLGGTFSGNPVSCAAALAAIRVMEREDLPARARLIGEQVAETFHRWWERYPLVGEARGLGAMQAIELVRDRATKEPAKDETARIVDLACRRGLLLIKAGTFDNVIRILVPLVVTDEQLREGLEILEGALAEVGG